MSLSLLAPSVSFQLHGSDSLVQEKCATWEKFFSSPDIRKFLDITLMRPFPNENVFVDDIPHDFPSMTV